MSAKTKLRVLTYREALATLDDKTDNFLYVRNVAKPVGNLNFVVTDDSGMKRSISITCETFIPVDLTTQASKRSILLSPDFKKYYQQDALVIVDSESAEQSFIDNPKYAAERKRLFKSMALSGTDVAEESITHINAEVVEGVELNVDPFVQNLLMEESDMEESDILHMLDSRLDSLEKKDVDFILSTSKINAVKAWAKENMELFED